MSSLIAFSKTYIIPYWPWILAAVTAVVTTASNAKVGGDSAQTWWHLLLDLLALRPQQGAQVRLLGGTHAVNSRVKLPLLMVSHHPGLPKGPGIANALTLLLVPLLVHGCAFCQRPENKNNIECKIETVVVQCSVPAIEASAAAILGDVFSALAGNAIDWDALIKLEEKYGIDVVGCAIAAADRQAQSTALRPMVALSSQDATVHAHAQEALGRLRVRVSR